MKFNQSELIFAIMFAYNCGRMYAIEKSKTLSDEDKCQLIKIIKN